MLNRILPEEGWICVAIAAPSGGFRHRFFRQDAFDAMEGYIASQDAKGETVYLAQASFQTQDNRKQLNVQKLRSFWLDIDCGEKKPYPTQKDGAAALISFCRQVALPLPIIVNSGNGLYAHWPLTEDIERNQWYAAATMLKGLTTACGFKADDSRTSDASSVLRPLGTHNKKDPDNPKPVTIVRDAPAVSFAAFVARLTEAAKKFHVSTKVLDPPKKQSLNADFLADQSGAPADAVKIREKCAQIEYIASNQASVEEPLWYAMVGLIRHCSDGEDWVHAWSEDHPDYDVDATDAKIEQHEKAGIGPTRCETFGKLRPDGCVGCKHKDRISSPIQLGKISIEVAPTLVESGEKIALPQGFKLTKDGLAFSEGDETVVFYPHELYITELAWDESVGYETATIKHHLPHEGWKEFKIRSSIVHDIKGFLMALADNHVKVLGADRKKVMCMYIESFMTQLQKNRQLAQLYCQMGWKTDGRFVLGKNIIKAGGEVEEVSLAKSVPASVEAFHTKGELAPWVEATDIFNAPGMEAHAFAFMAGAFAAPLMKFTGYSGALVAMLGPSGAGKTLTGMWALSAYGQPDRLIMLKDDTKNALVSRLGTYGNLPLYIDEVTNIDAMELSELVYRITQGRDKMRLNRDARERSVTNTWNTLALASSNSSITDRLSGLKLDASAELCRVVEFPVLANDTLDRTAATRIYRMLTNNYGLAGVEYLKYLAANASEHQRNIDALSDRLDKTTGASNDERFWSAVVATTIYGGLVAKKLGLIRFDIAKIMSWAERTIITMRATKKDVVCDAAGIIGRFLDAHVSNRLTVNSKNIASCTPRGALYVRVETGACRIFISRAYFREWVSKSHGSYTQIKNELEAMGALISTTQRKALGAGTEFSGPAQPCMVFNYNHPSLGMVVAALADDLQKAQSEAVG